MSFRSAIFKSTKRLRYQRFFVNARHSMRGHIVNNSLCHSTCVRNYDITELISNYISPQCTVLPFLPLMRQSFDHKFPKSSTTNPFSLWRSQSIVLAIRWIAHLRLRLRRFRPARLNRLSRKRTMQRCFSVIWELQFASVVKGAWNFYRIFFIIKIV